MNVFVKNVSKSQQKRNTITLAQIQKQLTNQGAGRQDSLDFGGGQLTLEATVMQKSRLQNKVQKSTLAGDNQINQSHVSEESSGSAKDQMLQMDQQAKLMTEEGKMNLLIQKSKPKDKNNPNPNPQANAFNNQFMALFKAPVRADESKELTKSKLQQSQSQKKVKFGQIDKAQQEKEEESKKNNDEILKALTNLMRIKIETNLKNKKFDQTSADFELQQFKNMSDQHSSAKPALLVSEIRDQMRRHAKKQIRMSKITNDQKAMTRRFLYKDQDLEERHRQNFEIYWKNKQDKVKTLSKQNVDSILQNSVQLNQFYQEKKQQNKMHRIQDEDDDASLGSLSSADERDLQLLLSGEHTYYFQCLEVIKQYNKLREKRLKEKMDKQRQKSIIFLYKIRDYLLCKKNEKDKSQSLRDGFGLKKEFSEPQPEKKLWMRTLSKIKSQKLGRKFSFTKRDFQKAFEEMKDGPPRKRTGRELWALAKKLVKQESKLNIAQNILKLNREMKAMKIAKEEENKINEFRINQQKKKKERVIMLDDDDIDVGDEIGWFKACLNKVQNYYQRYLIPTNNRKLQQFHLVVAITLFYDFFLTGMIMGNYRFLKGEDKNFMNQQFHYKLICVVQIIDIVLNFFKIESGWRRKRINPFRVFFAYVTGSFIPDVVAVIPYSMINPPFIFMRYLKLLKFNTYLMYIEDIIVEVLNHCLNSEQIKILISMFRLLIQVMLVSFFFACIWILIGQYNLVEREEGWIQEAIDKGYQQNDFVSCLITSIYWVITTFTSVGYGDIIGFTPLENIYQMIVEMVGICFFGYMIGTFQTLISSFGATDNFTEQQEALDLWLMKLDKSTTDRNLISSVYSFVKDFYNQKYKHDAMQIQKTNFFQQLKPRLQKECLDTIFKNYYDIFEFAFEDCDDGFRREVISNCQFRYYPNEHENTNQSNDTLDINFENQKIFEEWPMKIRMPVIQEAEQMSLKIYFIVSGQIHIMNKNGLFDYGRLSEGSYFGDISTLENEVNEYSYFSNPHTDKSVQFLSIDSSVFLKICEKYQFSKQIMKEKALRRKLKFNSFRTITLISYMKSIINNQHRFSQLIAGNQTIIQRLQTMRKYELKIDIMTSFVNYHQIKAHESKIRSSQSKDKIKSKSGYVDQGCDQMDERNALKKDLSLMLRQIKAKGKVKKKQSFGIERESEVLGSPFKLKKELPFAKQSQKPSVKPSVFSFNNFKIQQVDEDQEQQSNLKPKKEQSIQDLDKLSINSQAQGNSKLQQVRKDIHKKVVPNQIDFLHIPNEVQSDAGEESKNQLKRKIFQNERKQENPKKTQSFGNSTLNKTSDYDKQSKATANFVAQGSFGLNPDFQIEQTLNLIPETPVLKAKKQESNSKQEVQISSQITTPQIEVSKPVQKETMSPQSPLKNETLISPLTISPPKRLKVTNLVNPIEILSEPKPKIEIQRVIKINESSENTSAHNIEEQKDQVNQKESSNEQSKQNLDFYKKRQSEEINRSNQIDSHDQVSKEKEAQQSIKTANKIVPKTKERPKRSKVPGRSKIQRPFLTYRTQLRNMMSPPQFPPASNRYQQLVNQNMSFVQTEIEQLQLQNNDLTDTDYLMVNSRKNMELVKPNDLMSQLRSNQESLSSIQRPPTRNIEASQYQIRNTQGLKGRQASAKARASSRDNFSMNLQSRGNLFYEGGASVDQERPAQGDKQDFDQRQDEQNKARINLTNLIKYRQDSPFGMSEIPNKNAFNNVLNNSPNIKPYDITMETIQKLMVHKFMQIKERHKQTRSKSVIADNANRYHDESIAQKHLDLFQSEESIDYNQLKTEEEIDMQLSRCKQKLQKQLKLYLTQKQNEENTIQDQIKKRAFITEGQKRRREKNKREELLRESASETESVPDQDLDVDKPPKKPIDDGQEVYRDPSLNEIEISVRKQMESEFHYIDQIIEEFIHLNHINSTSQPNQEEELSYLYQLENNYQKVIPKPFMPVKKSREELELLAPDLPQKQVDSVINEQYKQQIKTYMQNYRETNKKHSKKVISENIHKKYGKAMEREVITNKLFKRVHDRNFKEINTHLSQVDHNFNQRLKSLRQRVNDAIHKNHK